MSSIFQLFGELGLKSSELEAGLKRADARLQATDANLNKVIAASNRLGDTSATVGRRYEKFGEGIEIQRQRLIANALAFEKGEINAKKFGSVIASVDKQVASLTSRIADAKARTVELSETNLTHFQNQIAGAVGASGGVTGAQQGHGSLFDINRSRPFLGLGAAFQATGLRQYGLDEQVANIAVILARQSGIIKTEVVAAAAGSKELAAGMAEASTVTTVFGATITTLAAGLAAAAISIFAAYKISKDIREEAEKRLKLEEDIAGAINKQILAAQELKKALAEDQTKRDFSRFAGGDDIVALQTALAAKQRQFDESNAAVLAERQSRANLLETLPGLAATKDKEGKTVYDNKAYIEATTKAQEEQNQKLLEDARTLAARIDDIKVNSEKSSADLIRGIQKDQLDAFKEQKKQEVEATKKANEEAKKQATELANHIKQANQTILDIFISTTDNPYEKIFDNARKAVEKLKEATKGLKIDISAPYAAIQAQAANAVFKQRLDDKLGALNYSDLARQFRAGKLDDLSTPEAFQKHIQDRLAALGVAAQAQNVYGKSVSSQFLDASGRPVGLPNEKALTDAQQHIRDQAIIAAVGNDPSKLNVGQQQLAAAAFDREAKRLENQEKVATDQLQATKDLTKATQDLIGTGVFIKIQNDAGDRAKVDIRPKGSATTNYYTKQ